jgi:hypothetical protein
MNGIVENLSLVQKFLKALTWTKLIQLTLFLTILGLALALYETREYLHEFTKYPRISQYATPVYTLGKETKDEINTIVSRSELIVGIVVSTVDFQKNTRHIIYRNTDSSDLKDLYENNNKLLTTEIPMFNDDVTNNARMVDLINGEFVCHPYVNSIDAIINPRTVPYAHTVCSNGIPPFYGMFSGVVSIITSRAPTVTESAQLRELTRSLSSKIYERDFK